MQSGGDSTGTVHYQVALGSSACQGRVLHLPLLLMTALRLLYAAWETLHSKHLRNPSVLGSPKSPLVSESAMQANPAWKKQIQHFANTPLTWQLESCT